MIFSANPRTAVWLTMLAILLLAALITTCSFILPGLAPFPSPSPSPTPAVSQPAS